MKTPVNAILSPLQVQPAAESVKTDQPRVGIRRYGDIVAFPDGEGSYTAFHARNLEVADIPKEIWNEMQETTFVEALPLRLLKNPESEDAVDLKTWEEELNPETTTQRISSQIRALTINTTQICNLACAYCAAGGDGTYNDAVKNISVEKTLPQIKFFIDRLPAHGTFQIIFLGGEPLLHPQGLVAIGTYAQELCKEKEINLSVKIITNGTLITEAIVESLKPLRPGWNISIDGPNEINDVVRPSKNGKPSTPQTLKGLELLVSNKSNWNGISLHAVFNKHNPDVFSTYMFFRELGVDYFELTLDVFESDPEMTAQYISGMNKVAEHAFTNGGEEALRKILTFDSFFESLDSQIRSENHCGSGKSLLSIDARNQVFTCPLEVSHKENMVGTGTYVKQEALDNLQNPLIELNKCGNCWARFVCGGGCLYNHKALTGDQHQKHPQYCVKTRSLLKTTILYYKQCRK